MKNHYCDYIVDFLFEKQVNEWLSVHTIHTYKTCFNTLLRFSDIDLSNLNTFTEINFKRFLWSMLVKYKWTSYTYNRYKNNYKVFCDYLVNLWVLTDNPLSNIKLRKLSKPLPKYLNKFQVIKVKLLINKIYNTDDFLSIRNKTILYTYLFTWLRLYELINLSIDDLDFYNWLIRIKFWKGKKERYVPLVDSLQKKILSYLSIRKKYIRNSSNTSNTLFPTRFNWLMQHRDIYNIIKQIQKELNFKLTPHMFRHTFATELVRKNINIYSISKILWHSRLDTTKIYLNLDLGTIKDTINLSWLYV